MDLYLWQTLVTKYRCVSSIMNFNQKILVTKDGRSWPFSKNEFEWKQETKKNTGYPQENRKSEVTLCSSLIITTETVSTGNPSDYVVTVLLEKPAVLRNSTTFLDVLSLSLSPSLSLSKHQGYQNVGAYLKVLLLRKCNDSFVSQSITYLRSSVKGFNPCFCFTQCLV